MSFYSPLDLVMMSAWKRGEVLRSLPVGLTPHLSKKDLFRATLPSTRPSWHTR